jgi:hypothetical protein
MAKTGEREKPRSRARRLPTRRLWRAPKPAPTLGFSPKNQGLERERERERCVGDADASTYGPTLGRNHPHHICPQRTHANNNPFIALTRPLSQESPFALKAGYRSPTPTRSYVSSDDPCGCRNVLKYYHKPGLIGRPNRPRPPRRSRPGHSTCLRSTPESLMDRRDSQGPLPARRADPGEIDGVHGTGPSDAVHTKYPSCQAPWAPVRPFTTVSLFRLRGHFF